MAASSPKAKSLAILLLAFSAVPLTYTVNSAQELGGEVGLLAAGVGVLTLICVLTYVAVGGGSGEKVDSIYYVLIIGSFAGVVDFIIGLEGEGFVSGFMTNYLKHGEPYLGTPMGTSVSFWDGTGHFACYLYMLYALANGKSYRRVGLFWAGAIGHSMIVYIPGIIMGRTGLCWSFLLNIPYMILPFTTGARFLQERPAKPRAPGRSIASRPLDWLFVAGLLLSATVAVLRGFAALGCRHWQFKAYLVHVEPYIMEPEAFPMIQMVVYLFDFLPYYLVTAASLLGAEQGAWMPDWALIHAGAAAQAQVTHIMSSVHPRTDPQFYPPPAAASVFWAVNLGLLIFPQLLAWRLNRATEAAGGGGKAKRR